MSKTPQHKHSTADVSKAIREVRQFHKTGHDSLRVEPGQISNAALVDEAIQAKLTPDMMRKARRFAKLYGRDDVTRLADLCRKYDFVLTRVHVLFLLRIRVKEDRRKFEREAISSHWSVSQFNEELVKRYGSRWAGGGRKPKIPSGTTAVLSQVESMCSVWRRWHTELHQPKNSKTASKLPKKVAQKIKDAVEQLIELEDLVGRELNTENFRRMPRRVVERLNELDKARGRRKREDSILYW